MQAYDPAKHLLNVDVSSLEPTIDFVQLKANGVSSAWLRAYGSAHASGGDTKFVGFVSQARSAGLPVGGYYFAMPAMPMTITDAQQQAQQFIDKLQAGFGTGNFGDLIPMLDLEDNSGSPANGNNLALSVTDLLTWANEFRKYFESATGRKLGLYTGHYFVQSQRNNFNEGVAGTAGNPLKDMPLWIAAYTSYGYVLANGLPDVGGWTQWTAWQYTDAEAHLGIGGTGVSNTSDTSKTMPLVYLMPPTKPTGVTATQVNDTTLRVTWTKIPDEDISGYHIYFDGYWKAFVSGLVNTKDITGLVAGKNYSIQVQAEDQTGDTTMSDPVNGLITVVTPAQQPTGGANMPKATTGITTSSVKRFLIDAGAIYINYGETSERLLGATRGGTSFEISTTIKEIEIDGTKGATKGAKRVTEVSATIKANLLEITQANLLSIMAGADSTITADTGLTGTTHNQIRRTREIADTDYMLNVALVGKLNGTTDNFIGVIFNALSEGGISIKAEHKNEAVLEVTFVGHFDPASMNTEPWAIRIPANNP